VFTGGRKVGINLTNPTVNFDVAGDTTNSITIAQFLNALDATAEYVEVLIGKADSAGQAGRIRYIHNTAIQNDRAIAFGTSGGGTPLVVTYGGNVSINAYPSKATFDVAGTDIMFRMFGAGDLYVDANGRLYVASDEKLKTAIMPYTGGLAKILNVKPISFNFNSASGLDTFHRYFGFSANQLQQPQAIPEAVYEKKDTKVVVINDKITEVPVLDKDGKQTTTLSVDLKPIVATLINAVKEQQVEITNQQAQINNLTARVAALEKKVGV
jgi:hypothetical protein